MSFAAKGKKCIKSRQQIPHTVVQKLSPKPTRNPVSETLNYGGRCRKNRHFLKNWHPVRGPMSFAAKRKNVQNQDKQTPHTVPQKLSPKPTWTPLKVKVVTSPPGERAAYVPMTPPKLRFGISHPKTVTLSDILVTRLSLVHTHVLMWLLLLHYF